MNIEPDESEGVEYDWPADAAAALRALIDPDSGRIDNWSDR